MLLQCVPLDLCPRGDRWMCNTLCPRARGEKGDRRCRNSGLSIFRDIMTSIDSRTIDLQLAIISTLISGLVVGFTLVVVLN